ncbi:hypothetical protein FF1_035015 [Malus domestica]
MVWMGHGMWKCTRADCHGIEGRRHDMVWMGHASGWIGLMMNRHVAGLLQASGWKTGDGSMVARTGPGLRKWAGQQGLSSS